MFTRRPARLFVVATLAACLALSTVAAAVDAAGPHRETERQTLLRYARSTWASFVAMTNPSTGLPADKLNADGTTSPETSDTNIGAYMWSTVVAERLGIISH
ncbi:MAG: cellobiose phosphorylase, partial [Chloroflexota bacterium]